MDFELAWPGDRAGLLERRRAEAIVRRIGAIAFAFGALTVAWIPVDIAVFAESVWTRLACARVVAALALLALALGSRHGEATRTGAYARLGALFAIAAIFFPVTVEILRDAPLDGFGRGIAAAYAFMPFLLASGIAAFPLALAESALLGAFALVLEAWALDTGRAGLSVPAGIDALWLLALVAAVGAFAAASQLGLMAALVRQSIRDPLTGCLRRESGRELIEAQLRTAARNGTPLTLLFADIDRFKAVNDDHGHEFGDQVLARVAAGLSAALRASDILVRWGGEEFVVALPESTASEAMRLIERLRPGGLGELPNGKKVTVSIGVAEARKGEAIGAAALVEAADKRMYLAKQAGRNRCVSDDSGAAVPVLA